MLARGFGGGERYFVDLALALARDGHEVQAMVHRDFNAMHMLEGEPGLRIDSVNALGMWDWFSTRKLIRKVTDFGPEVMHSHMARAAWAGSKVVKASGARLVATTHNYVKLKYYRNVHRFIPTTADQARYLREKGVAEAHIREIPNFSMLEAVAAPPARSDGPLRFVSFGRFVEKKGYAVLLDAFALALSEGLGDATLRLGGDGPLAEQLKSRAKTLGIADKVRFDGWIEDVGAYLEGADVFVLPSLDEPFGIVMLEAMARGRPIVTTRTQGPSEVLDDSCTYYAQIGDIRTLADGLLAVARDADAAAGKAREALDRYRRLYSREAVVPQIVSLYREALSAP